MNRINKILILLAMTLFWLLAGSGVALAKVMPNVSIVESNEGLSYVDEIYRAGGTFDESHDGGATWVGPISDQDGRYIDDGDKVAIGHIKVCAGLRFLGVRDLQGVAQITENPSGVYSWNASEHSTQSVCILVMRNGSGSFTVHYDANGGAGSMTDQPMVWTHSHGNNACDEMPLLRTNRFTRAGYQFTGWNTEPDGSGEFFCNMHDGYLPLDYEVADGGTVTLYAQWKKLPTSATASDGELDLTIPANQQVTIDGLPAGAFYEVVETSVPSGWTLVHDKDTAGIIQPVVS